MDIGVFSFNTPATIRPDALARTLEQRGFESVWFGEHSHIPVERRSPYPAGGELPEHYWHMLDPFVSLAAAAQVTTHLKLATGVCLIIERDPIMTAKEVATLDYLSGGRVLFGIGAGWNAEEMENHGTDFKTRFKLMRERVKAMKTIWTEEQPSFHSQFVNFDPIWSYPKPTRKPHPPVILGSATEQSRQRVVDYCEGWAPLDMLVGDIPAAITDIHRRCELAKRDPASIELSMFAWEPPSLARLDQFRSWGITRTILFAPVKPHDEVLRFLDGQQALVDHGRGS
jgi:probable F420-dependent oxidoreductase